MKDYEKFGIVTVIVVILYIVYEAIKGISNITAPFTNLVKSWNDWNTVAFDKTQKGIAARAAIEQSNIGNTPWDNFAESVDSTGSQPIVSGITNARNGAYDKWVDTGKFHS